MARKPKGVMSDFRWPNFEASQRDVNASRKRKAVNGKPEGRSNGGAQSLRFSTAAIRERTKHLPPPEKDPEFDSWMSRLGGAALMLETLLLDLPKDQELANRKIECAALATARWLAAGGGNCA